MGRENHVHSSFKIDHSTFHCTGKYLHCTSRIVKFTCQQVHPYFANFRQSMYPLNDPIHSPISADRGSSHPWSPWKDPSRLWRRWWPQGAAPLAAPGCCLMGWKLPNCLWGWKIKEVHNRYNRWNMMKQSWHGHTSYIVHHTSYIISIHVLSWTNQLGQPLCPNQTWLGKAAERWTPGIFHVAMGNPLMEDLMRQHWNTIYKWVIFDWNHTLWTVHTIWEWWIYCMFYAALHHIFIYTYAVNTCPAAFARAASAHRCPFSDVNGRSRFFPVLVGYSAVPPSWKWSNEVQKRPR